MLHGNNNSTHIGKSAVYIHTGNYNVNSDSTYPDATTWNTKIFDSIGFVYVLDIPTYKHDFRVPSSGVYRINVLIRFDTSGWFSDCALYGCLIRNNINQSSQITTANNYKSCLYSYVNQANAGDLFIFALLKNSGVTAALSVSGSRFMDTYLGKE